MLKLTAGAALFLLGTGLLGESLEGRCSRLLIRHLLGSPRRGFVTGLLATAAVQSSSAVTVLLGTLGRPLAESFPVIMGANVGSTVTAWLVWAGLSLPGLAVFLPVGLLVSVLIYLLKGWKGPAGFCLLLTGMEAMTSAAGGLGESGALREALLLAESPWRGVLLGAATTAALQSSGAAIGILQVLCAAGQLRGGAVGPILMGQNIGTCATALLASLAGGREARAVALAHLGFNLVGTAGCLPVWLLVWGRAAVVTPLGVALLHTGFNLLTCGVFALAGPARRGMLLSKKSAEYQRR